MRKVLIFMCVLGVMTFASPAWAYYLSFTDANTNDSKWSTTGNWIDELGGTTTLPGDGGNNVDTVYMGGGKTCILDSISTGSTDICIKRLHASYDSQLGTLQIEDGAWIEVWTYSFFGLNGPGKIVQNGGTVDMFCNQDWPWNSGYASTYELHGGILNRPYSGLTYWLMDGDAGTAISCSYSQDGGVYTELGSMEVAVGALTGSTATVEISGGTAHIENLRLMRKASGAGATGTGNAIFNVIGSQATITAGNYLQANPGAGLDATLNCKADSGACSTIACTGTATFEDGTTLNLTRLASTPAPEKGDHDLLTAVGGITDSGLVLNYDSTFWNVTVGANAITATFLYIPGDCALFPGTNNDVDDADLSILLNNFGTTTGMTWAHGDFNNDAGVADADLSILLAHWDTVGSVPEPATLCLLGLGALGLLRRRRR